MHASAAPLLRNVVDFDGQKYYFTTSFNSSRPLFLSLCMSV